MHVEYEGGIGRNHARIAAFTISQVAGDEKLVLPTVLHKGEGFEPALDESGAAHFETYWFHAVVGSVKFSSVDQVTGVMNANLLSILRNVSKLGLADHTVAETAGAGDGIASGCIERLVFNGLLRFEQHYFEDQV